MTNIEDPLHWKLCFSCVEALKITWHMTFIISAFVTPQLC